MKQRGFMIQDKLEFNNELKFIKSMIDVGHDNSEVERYIDWLITVPMQIVEFYLILAAVVAVSLGVFWKLLAASLVMLLGGYAGEVGYLDATVGFVIGMAGWIFIIYYVFAGEAAQIKDAAGNENLSLAFNGIKWIVTVGWAIYPLGYFLGYLGGGVDAVSYTHLRAHETS